MNIRPSNLVRGIENVLIGTTRVVAGGTVYLARSAKDRAVEAKRQFEIEYGARKALAFKNEVEEHAARVASMSPAERMEYERTLAEMNGRFAELQLQQNLRDQQRASKRRIWARR